MQQKTLESQLVRHCAAVLAGVKVANYYCTPETPELIRALKEWNLLFQKEKIRFRKVCSCGVRCGIFVYREEPLRAILEDPAAQSLLKSLGYRDLSFKGALKTLQTRLLYQRLTKGNCFPHELGLFLGYPIKDVEAFIRFEGKNALLVGPWKVYHDVEAAQRRFNQYTECRRLLSEAVARGTRLKASVEMVERSFAS